MWGYSSILEQIAQTISEWEIKVFIRPFLKYAQLFVAFISLLTDKNELYPKPVEITGSESYDYIIIGGGTAGCVIANRLTEDRNVSVLLIEAGDFPSYVSNIPAFFPLVDYTTEEWNFYSTDDCYSSQAVTDRKIHLTAGKMLGGSSGLTYLLYARGAKADFDRWANMGNEGWDWNSVLPYFKKGEYNDDVEIYRSKTSSLHGENGLMHVRKPKWESQTAVYLKGFRENGRATLDDVNGNVTVGYGLAEYTTDDHYRESTAVTYIQPMKGRKNFNLLLNSLVTKILFNGNKITTGVEVALQNGKKVTVKAKKEVILCAGAINSPKLLLLSGIGPKHHIKQHKIKVIKDSPGVGQNFTDTPLVLLSVTGEKGFLKSCGNNLLGMTSLNMFPNPIILGHGTLNKSQSYADYQLNALPMSAGSILPAIFCKSIFRYHDDVCIAFTKEGLLVETLFVAHSMMHPTSKGNVTLRCSDPWAPPNVKTGFYSEPIDLDRHARYIIDYLKVIKTKVFRKFHSKIINVNLKQCECYEFNTLDYWKCYILNLVSPQWNFSGTCSMGVEGEGVVDNRLRVRGVTGLRVADASVIPAPVTGNYVAVVVMIGEKVSDMIKEDQKSSLEECDQ